MNEARVVKVHNSKSEKDKIKCVNLLLFKYHVVSEEKCHQKGRAKKEDHHRDF